MIYLKCESRVKNQRAQSGSNASEDMQKQARKGADRRSGLKIGKTV